MSLPHETLAELRAAEENAPACSYCGGKGHFLDTTYDRTGVETCCPRCNGEKRDYSARDALLRNHSKALIAAAEEHGLNRDALSVANRSFGAIRNNLHAAIEKIAAERDSLRATNAELEGKLAEAEDARSLAVANLVHADEKIEELQEFIRGNQLASAADIIAERDSLRARVAELENDKERLDWLEENPSALDDCTWLNVNVGRCFNFMPDGGTGGKTIGECAASKRPLRAAIDAAKSA